MSSIIWKSEVRNVSDLVLNKENPRKISKESMNVLKERIKERGFHAVIVIDTDNVVLSGNQRLKALQELKVEKVTTLVPDRKLTKDERKRIVIESNLNAGEWDFDILKSVFEVELINTIGFDDVTLDKIWDDKAETVDDDFDEKKELAKIKKPNTKLGDIIVMGRHKLTCGSSTDPEVLKKLFGNKKASMIYSDPIYNLKIDYNKGIGGRQNYGGNVQDDRTPEDYKQFITKSLQSALSVTNLDAHIFYWNDQAQIGLIQQIYEDLGIENKRVCLWIKNGQNPTPKVAFSKCYEPCIYGVRGRPHLSTAVTDLNEVMNKEFTTGNKLLEETLDHLDIWAVKRLPGQEYEHATSKPPSLHEKAIRRCTRTGDIILDSFSGSASTMIAAEKLGRTVYAVELEPAFCDLAMIRYEKLTGQRAQVIRHEER